MPCPIGSRGRVRIRTTRSRSVFVERTVQTISRKFPSSIAVSASAQTKEDGGSIMRYWHCAIGVVLAAGLATGVGVRAQDPQTTPQTNPPRNQTGMNATMKVTGCVERDTSSTSATGSASSSSTAGMSADMFKLTHLDQEGKSSTGSSAGSMSDPLMGAKEIQLKPESSKVSLSEHLNHKVEVTGKVTSMTGAATGGGSTGRAGGQSDLSSPHMPTFEVSSLRMISSTCSQ